MAKAAKKRGKKKAAKTTKRKAKARKSSKKSVKRSPAKRRPAKRKPAKRKPAKRAPAAERKSAKRAPAKRRPATREPKPQAEPWPMIFAVLLAMAVALIAGWYANGVAEAAVVLGHSPFAAADGAVISLAGSGECDAAVAWFANFTAPALPIAN